MIQEGWDISDHSDEERVKDSAIKRAVQAKIHSTIESYKKSSTSLIMRKADGTKCVRDGTLLPG